MNTYLISYDLIAPSKDYSLLYEAIKSYSRWARPLESLWLIKADETVAEVRDKLLRYVDANDKIFVVNVTGEAWGTVNISQEVTDWMKKNLSE